MSRMLAALKKLQGSGQDGANLPVASIDRGTSAGESPAGDATLLAEPVEPPDAETAFSEESETHEADILMSEEIVDESPVVEPPLSQEIQSDEDDTQRAEAVAEPPVVEDTLSQESEEEESDTLMSQEETALWAQEDTALWAQEDNALWAQEDNALWADEDTTEPTKAYPRDIELVKRKLEREKALLAELVADMEKEEASVPTDRLDDALPAGIEERPVGQSRETPQPEVEILESFPADETEWEPEVTAAPADEVAPQQLEPTEAPTTQPQDDDDEPTELETPQLQWPEQPAVEPAVGDASEPWEVQPAEHPSRRGSGPLSIPFDTPPQQQPVEPPDTGSRNDPPPPRDIAPPEREIAPPPHESESPAPPADAGETRQQGSRDPEPATDPAWQQVFVPSREGLLSEQLADAWGRLQALLHERAVRVCLVYSVEAGKDTCRLTAQLAMQAVEQLEGRVLLVDGDPQSRQLTRAFAERPMEGGGENQTAGPLPVSEVSDRLWVLPADDDESPKGYSERLNLYLRRFPEKYSLVLIDGGSGENRLFPVLVEFCDAALLHVRLGSVTLEQAQAALKKLHSLGIMVLGTIVTDVPAAEAEQAVAEFPLAV